MIRGLKIFTLLILMSLNSNLFAQEMLTLDDAVSIALTGNTQVLNAKSTWNTQKAQRLGAWAGVLPRISFNVSPSRNFSAETITYDLIDIIENEIIIGSYVGEKPVPEYYTTSYFGRLNLNQNIWDGGRSFRQIKQGNAGVKAGEFGYLNSAVTAIYTVKQNYYNLAKLIEQRTVLVLSLEEAEKQLQNSQNMYDVGSVAQGDVFRSEVSVGNNKIMLIDQDIRIKTAKQQLNQSLGRDINTPFEIQSNISTTVNYSINQTEVAQKALSTNPNITSNEYLVAGNYNGVKANKAGLYPTLSYGASYTRAGNNYERWSNDMQKHFRASINVSLNFNLFDGFQTKSAIQQAQNNLRISEENYEDAKRTVNSNVTTYYNELQGFKEKIDINQMIVKSAEEDFRLAEERYRIGSGTLLEVITARSNMTSARFQLVSLQYDSKAKEAQLQSAIGEIESKYAHIIK